MNELTKHCLRCGYQWLSRIERPKACPNCHSYRHDSYRKRDLNPAPVTKPSDHVDHKEEK